MNFEDFIWANCKRILSVEKTEQNDEKFKNIFWYNRFKEEERVGTFGQLGTVGFKRKKSSVSLFLDARDIRYVSI